MQPCAACARRAPRQCSCSWAGRLLRCSATWVPAPTPPCTRWVGLAWAGRLAGWLAGWLCGCAAGYIKIAALRLSAKTAQEMECLPNTPSVQAINEAGDAVAIKLESPSCPWEW